MGVVAVNKEQQAWRALPARQRVDLALSSSKRMGTLFAHLMHAKLCNMSGSAYRCHPQCIYRDGILITDHWKTWGQFDISVANDPKQTPRKGCQDPMSTGGDPYPTIESGWTRVWNGQWEKQGPWQSVIVRVLEELTVEADAFYEQEADKQAAARLEAERERQAKEESLLNAWS